MSSSLQELTPHAEIVSKTQARLVNVTAAVGLMNVLKSNLGPRGTLKLLVGGAGQLRLTKDGLVLLKEMQIQHPTACLIARTATAQDDVTGDGTTSTVLLCGELLKQTQTQFGDVVHPRVLVDGLEKARDEILEFLKDFARPVEDPLNNRDLLTSVASTSLHTKLDPELAETIANAVVDSIQCIAEPDKPMDLNRVEVMAMSRKLGTDSRFVNGLVLDHGARHPGMPKLLKNCHILVANVSLEYEKTEVQSGFVYSSAKEREALVESERTWLDERCKHIVDLKRKVCKDGESFVVINQKGVDPLSLDIFAKEGILCLRRAKRRNMERLTLACGGTPVLSLEDMDETVLGYAGQVSEVTLGEDKFTFVEDCRHPKSCTLLLQGPNQHSIQQMKDAVRDGLRALQNAIQDGAVVPGAGAFEVAASLHLKEQVIPRLTGKIQLGVQAFADALLIIPKTLAENAGLDLQEALLQVQDERKTTGLAVGLNCTTGLPMLPEEEGVWDNVRVKRQSLYLSTVLASQLLLVDEVMRAGKQMGKQPTPMDEDGGMM